MPHLFNAAKDVRLAVFVSVRAHTQVDFPRVLVRLEGFGDPYIWKFYYGLRGSSKGSKYRELDQGDRRERQTSTK